MKFAATIAQLPGGKWELIGAGEGIENPKSDFKTLRAGRPGKYQAVVFVDSSGTFKRKRFDLIESKRAENVVNNVVAGKKPAGKTLA